MYVSSVLPLELRICSSFPHHHGKFFQEYHFFKSSLKYFVYTPGYEDRHIYTTYVHLQKYNVFHPNPHHGSLHLSTRPLGQWVREVQSKSPNGMLTLHAFSLLAKGGVTLGSFFLFSTFEHIRSMVQIYIPKCSQCNMFSNGKFYPPTHAFLYELQVEINHHIVIL